VPDLWSQSARAGITVEDRERLRAAQSTNLTTCGHRDQALCNVRFSDPYPPRPPAETMCPDKATHWVERYDYALGATAQGRFTPGVIMTQICDQHASIVEDEPGLISLRALIRTVFPMTATVGLPPLTRVLDCPRCVWRDFGAIGLGSFADRWRDRLDEAGRELIRRPLVEAWRKRGYLVALVCHHDCAADPGSLDDPPRELFTAVRQAAANTVQSEELVYAADLVDAYRAFADRDY
jgi:hypothetical protein